MDGDKETAPGCGAVLVSEELAGDYFLCLADFLWWGHSGFKTVVVWKVLPFWPMALTVALFTDMHRLVEFSIKPRLRCRRAGPPTTIFL